jgi:hypothetical protein
VRFDAWPGVRTGVVVSLLPGLPEGVGQDLSSGTGPVAPANVVRGVAPGLSRDMGCDMLRGLGLTLRHVPLPGIGSSPGPVLPCRARSSPALTP